MKTLALFLTCLVAVSTHAQLPATSPAHSGFDPARLEVLHAITKSFVDEGQHAGAITLLARNGKLVDFQTYGYRDLEKKLPMERDLPRLFDVENHHERRRAGLIRRRAIQP